MKKLVDPLIHTIDGNEWHFTVNFTSTGAEHKNLTLVDLLDVFCDHYGHGGDDPENITVVVSETSEMVSEFEGETETVFAKIYISNPEKTYSLGELIELAPYFSRL